MVIHPTPFRKVLVRFALVPLGVLVVAPCLTSCNSTAPAGGTGGTLSGQLYAPAGGDVAGTRVFACTGAEAAPGCSKQVTISRSGASAPYQLTDLPPGSYTVIADNDRNADDTLDTGDEYGAYSKDGVHDTPVTPPAAGLDIRMTIVTTGGGGGGGSGSGKGPLFPDGLQDGKAPIVMVGADGVTHMIYDGVPDPEDAYPVRYGECSSDCQKASAWSFITLGDYGAAGIGGGARLALDPSGAVHALWYTQANVSGDGAFWYARCDSGCTTAANWHAAAVISGGFALTGSSFAVGNDGQARFIFLSDSGVVYAECDSGCVNADAWQLGDIGFGIGGILILDGSGRAHLAYEAIAPNVLDGEDIDYATCDTGCTDAANWQSVVLTSVSPGLDDTPYAFALSPAGTPRLAFYTSDASAKYPDQLVFAACDAACTDGDNWYGSYTGMPSYSGHSGIDLAIGPAGTPYLVYGDAADLASDDGLELAVCTADCTGNSPSWSTAEIETKDDITQPPPDPCGTGQSFWQLGSAPSIALDGTGTAHLAYEVYSYATCLVGYDPNDGTPVYDVTTIAAPVGYAESNP